MGGGSCREMVDGGAFYEPDMSVTSTWVAPRRCVMASRMLASVIWDMVTWDPEGWRTRQVSVVWCRGRCGRTSDVAKDGIDKMDLAAGQLQLRLRLHLQLQFGVRVGR